MENNQIVDINHFNNLIPPLAPNSYEIALYNIHKKNNTLLLGYTKQLIKLSNESMDINPPVGSNTIKQDWFTINKYYDTIIGDGVLNLTGGELVYYLSKWCSRLIIRFFTKYINGMKYATYFKHNTSFLLPDQTIHTQESCVILIWDFKI